MPSTYLGGMSAKPFKQVTMYSFKPIGASRESLQNSRKGFVYLCTKKLASRHRLIQHFTAQAHEKAQRQILSFSIQCHFVVVALLLSVFPACWRVA